MHYTTDERILKKTDAPIKERTPAHKKTAEKCTPYRMYGGFVMRCFARSAKLVARLKNIQGSIFFNRATSFLSKTRRTFISATFAAGKLGLKPVRFVQVSYDILPTFTPLKKPPSNRSGLKAVRLIYAADVFKQLPIVYGVIA